jgi:hypothetical protein
MTITYLSRHRSGRRLEIQVLPITSLLPIRSDGRLELEKAGEPRATRARCKRILPNQTEGCHWNPDTKNRASQGASMGEMGLMRLESCVDME